MDLKRNINLVRCKLADLTEFARELSPRSEMIKILMECGEFRSLSKPSATNAGEPGGSAGGSPSRL